MQRKGKPRKYCTENGKQNMLVWVYRSSDRTQKSKATIIWKKWEMGKGRPETQFLTKYA
jgi:hypothetical protein